MKVKESSFWMGVVLGVILCIALQVISISVILHSQSPIQLTIKEIVVDFNETKLVDELWKKTGLNQSSFRNSTEVEENDI